MRTNEFGQPVGAALPEWKEPPFPPTATLQGRHCRIEPFSVARHARALFDGFAEAGDAARWTYSFSGPFDRFETYEKWCLNAEASHDPQFYALVDAGGRAAGSCAYMRIDPKHGVIEIGNIYFSSRLARTRAATEILYLMISNVFDLGYRRFEWKCDSCNLPSRAAATRFGFTYEGMFRQAIVNKGRNRDTSWFAIIDLDWNAGLKDAYLRWLDPGNFNADGTQRLRLSELTAPFVHARS